MKMNKIAALLALPLALTAMAVEAGDGKTLYGEKTCNACHGPEGKKALMPQYPKLAGQNEAYLVVQMNDIKSGKRANGDTAAMKGVMHLVNDQDIKDIAAYLSKVKP